MSGSSATPSRPPIRERLGLLPVVLRGFGAQRVLLRAAALTYLSIVSLVPLLAVVVYGLQLFGRLDLQKQVQAFVLENLAVGVREQVASTLSHLLANVGAGVEGGVGLLLLLLSAVLLLRNVEQAFDDLWGIHVARPLWRQVPRYLGLLLAGPLVLGLSLAFTATLRAWATFHGLLLEQRLLALVPLVLSAAGFTLLNKIAPAAKVRWRAALIAGCAAAAIWETAKLVFGLYTAYVIKTDVLYGPLIALPLFFVWIYVSWLIVLFGGRLAYAIQHPSGLRLGADDQGVARAMELCAARMAVALAQAQAEGTGEQTIHGLAGAISFPEGMVRTLAPILAEGGLVEIEGRHLSLARPAPTISLGEVLAAVRSPARLRSLGGDPTTLGLAALLRNADGTAEEALAGLDLARLASADDGADGLPLAKA